MTPSRIAFIGFMAVILGCGGGTALLPPPPCQGAYSCSNVGKYFDSACPLLHGTKPKDASIPTAWQAVAYVDSPHRIQITYLETTSRFGPSPGTTTLTGQAYVDPGQSVGLGCQYYVPSDNWDNYLQESYTETKACYVDNSNNVLTDGSNNPECWTPVSGTTTVLAGYDARKDDAINAVREIIHAPLSQRTLTKFDLVQLFHSTANLPQPVSVNSSGHFMWSGVSQRFGLPMKTKSGVTLALHLPGTVSGGIARSGSLPVFSSATISFPTSTEALGFEYFDKKGNFLGSEPVASMKVSLSDIDFVGVQGSKVTVKVGP